MQLRPRLICLLLASFSLARAEDLPLPVAGQGRSERAGVLKPTMVIKPPVKAGSVKKADSAAELAIIESERCIVEEQMHKLIAEAAKNGNANALNQLILMSGPIDPAVSRALKPPTSSASRVALIGLAPSEAVGKSVEQFFGAPMTPDREKALLETVKTQLAGKDKADYEVRIAGWWPKEGVLALSVVPRS